MASKVRLTSTFTMVSRVLGGGQGLLDIVGHLLLKPNGQTSPSPLNHGLLFHQKFSKPIKPWLLEAGSAVGICSPALIFQVFIVIRLASSTMTVPRWLLADIEHTLTATGYKHVVKTNVPCHLWLRWTLTHPHIHSKTVLIRGLRLKDDVRFCFVTYHDNEQEEAGDTLIHTFTKEPWPHCETRYFYFHGTIGGQISPSTTAIFTLHRIAPPAPTLQEYHDSPLDSVYALSRDGQLAQSFTPQADYAVKKIAIPMQGTINVQPGIWHVQIRTNNVDEPSEDILWEDTIAVNDFPTPGYAWFEFPVTGVDAQIGVPLWYVGFRTDYLIWYDYPYQRGDDDDLYPRGEMVNRSSPFAAWVGQGEGHDLGFRIWGL
ncbi:hypothetical protein ES705_27830 [subsurface metagenome]